MILKFNLKSTLNQNIVEQLADKIIVINQIYIKKNAHKGI